MTLRDKKQLHFANLFIESGKHGILNLCPRFGKIRTSIHILNQLKPKSILIAYPDENIKTSWKSDFEELEYDDSNVTYTTHLSLKHHTLSKFDIVIIDEIHLLSEFQIEICKTLFENNNVILGLTGTLSRYTEINLEKELDIHVIAEYPIETAIEEKVITDYEIEVIRVPLDNQVKNNYKGKYRTEKKQFEVLSWVIDQMTAEGKDTKFMRLKRMAIVQNSISKVRKTRELISKNQNKRTLVFCGTIKSSESLGIPCFHTKSKDKNILQDFAEGKGNHLAVIKIGNSGITYKPLDNIIINYFDSNSENLAQKINRAMAFEYNREHKKAKITIISTNEKVELQWLKRALEFFDENKIKYL